MSDERDANPGESNSKPGLASSKERQARPRHPKSMPGLFYVEDGACIACEAPEREAPDLIGHETDRPRYGSYHCYFKAQPEGTAQVEQAIMACVVSCCKAVRYAGDDLRILKRIVELGGTSSAQSCDALDGLSPSQIRGALAKWTSHQAAEDNPVWDASIDGSKPRFDPFHPQ